MLVSLLGSENREKVLLFILSRGAGYGSEIARFFDTDLNQIQKQLDGMEAGGVLVSRSVGRTRLYEFNPRYPFLDELKGLLGKAMNYYPQSLRESLTMVRRRPRRKGKPL